MDFPTAWKASSIVLTGAFGMLGLLTEFKDKHTKKITKWGYISLAGIVVSTILGTTAQLKKSFESERARERTAAETLALARKSDAMLYQINRSITPLKIDHIDMDLSIDCSKQDQFALFCDAASHILQDPSSDERAWENWPGLDHHIFTSYILRFSREGTPYRTGSHGDLEVDVFPVNYGPNRNIRVNGWDGRFVFLSLTGFKPTPDGMLIGSMRSTVDLPGSTLEIDFANELIRVKPEQVIMVLEDGERLYIPLYPETVKSSTTKDFYFTEYHGSVDPNRKPELYQTIH